MLAQASKGQQIYDISVLAVLKLIIKVLNRNNIQEVLVLELEMHFTISIELVE